MKKMRDQARKENNALKSKAKGKAKAVKAAAETAVDSVAAASTAGAKQQDIGTGAGKIIGDIKHTGHQVAEKLKHH